MQAQLVAIDGPLGGSAWPIDEHGITLGRDASCNVRVQDPLASRQHARLTEQQGRIVLEDLGARNPLLVNGEPRRGGTLRVGETVSVGAELFLLAGATTNLNGSSQTPGEATVSLGQYLALHPPGEEPVKLERHLSTVEQLAYLFEAVTRMAPCTTSGDLIAVAQDELCRHFEPRQIWITRPKRGKTLTTYAATVAAQSKPLPPPVLEALDSPSPFILAPPDEGRGSFLVAPLKLGETSVGAVALESGSESYRSADLRVLQLFAMILGSFLATLQAQEQLIRDSQRLRMRAGESLDFVGSSPASHAVRRQADRAAQSDLNVLILGETGTGKELIARRIHQASSRSRGPFIAVNCAAIPDDLFESELFGHAKGAYTNAHTSAQGLVSQADGGTLLLDEVADLSPKNQARVLRVIEYGVYRRLGEHEERTVDMRVVAATNKDVHAAIADGSFRPDLFHRLNGFEITIPPLRERRDDIPELAKHFFELGRGSAARPLTSISDGALASLHSHSWMGNVRELRNNILRGISLAESEQLQLEDLFVADTGAHAPRSEDPPVSLKDAERIHIEATLRRHGGNVVEAAHALGISRSTLYKKMSDLEVRV